MSPLKPGQTRIYVYRQRNRRKVGRPKKRMITVTKDTLTKVENNARKRRSRTVVNDSDNIVRDGSEYLIDPYLDSVYELLHSADSAILPEE
jgi:hypothetical protein